MMSWRTLCCAAVCVWFASAASSMDIKPCASSVPDWLLQTPAKRNRVYGVGVSGFGGTEFERAEQSEWRARTSLAFAVSARVSTLVTDRLHERGEQTTQVTERAARHLTLLRWAEEGQVLERERDAKGRVFTLMSAPASIAMAGERGFDHSEVAILSGYSTARSLTAPSEADEGALQLMHAQDELDALAGSVVELREWALCITNYTKPEASSLKQWMGIRCRYEHTTSSGGGWTGQGQEEQLMKRLRSYDGNTALSAVLAADLRDRAAAARFLPGTSAGRETLPNWADDPEGAMPGIVQTHLVAVGVAEYRDLALTLMAADALARADLPALTETKVTSSLADQGGQASPDTATAVSTTRMVTVQQVFGARIARRYVTRSGAVYSLAIMPRKPSAHAFGYRSMGPDQKERLEALRKKHGDVFKLKVEDALRALDKYLEKEKTK